jgi:hypothetical protein
MNMFGTYFNHLPSLGTKEDSERHEGLYNNTLSFYEALYSETPPKSLWEPTDERFSSDLFMCSNINL